MISVSLIARCCGILFILAVRIRVIPLVPEVYRSVPIRGRMVDRPRVSARSSRPVRVVVTRNGDEDRLWALAAVSVAHLDVAKSELFEDGR